MGLVRVGRDRIAGLITGAATCHWGTSGASLFVSSSTAAYDPASTWFGSSATGSTGMAGYPLTNSNVLQFQGTYTTSEANYQWESWGVNTATASGGGSLLNVAAAQALGTKAATQSWQLTACVTITT